ncbi:hypothetical protein TSUD_152280 [Trifolium subterraneum]|uniref:Uncharacterized protein n=1 Tax=Trifolium subterraneum TaxID=3900 RepID=A0A2Z6N944_TRISU|nr:hypothetical protein TSUD_152280 [Trifolium subterraneum]
MIPFCIPWQCLDSSSSKPIPENLKPKPQKSFVQAVKNVCEIPLSQLPQACVKGNRLAIEIPEEAYLAGLEKCKHNLHGRIIWPKGATPLTVAAVKTKLAPLWKDLDRWGVASIGKGYYEFSFSSLEDVRRVRSIASWSLNPGTLKLFAWTTDFNPRTQQNNTAQVWVRFYGLAQEYWSTNILFAIASSIGTPICTDAVTAKPIFERTFGQFARVLVDMDLSQAIRNKVLVERKGFAFFVDLEYENLPDFCTNCNVIGHCVNNCKKIYGLIDPVMTKEQGNIKKQNKETKKVYVQTKNDKIEQHDLNTLQGGIESSSDKDVDSPINVTSDIDVEALQVRNVNNIAQKSLDKDQEVEAIKLLGDSSSTKKTVSPNKIPQTDCILKSSSGTKNSNFQQNRFIALEDSDLQNSKQQNLDCTEDIEVEGDSEFVQDTPQEDTEDGNVNVEIISKHDQNQQNKNFLNQSWANMAEDDDAELKLLEELERAHEHNGFTTPSRTPIDDFNDWTDSNQLIHLPTKGANFTWSNGRLGNRFTERRLDRAICSQSWLDVCSSIDCTTLVKNRSDHYPLLLEFSSHSFRFMSSFKFMKMWTMHDDCRNVISQCWNERVDVGCPMFVLNSKLKRLKTKLKIWNKEIFGNVHTYVSTAEAHLKHIQLQIQHFGHNDQLMKLEKDAQAALDIALDRQEVFWKEKSKIKWQLEGDRNTAYFHRMAKIKNTTKIISSLKHGNTTLTDPSQISDHVVDYYKTLFCTNPILQEQLLVEQVIPNLVGDNINALLTVLPSAEEIKHVVFDLNKDGAPGPDGFGAIFFQTYWDIIHVDVINAVLQFFSSDKIPTDEKLMTRGCNLPSMCSLCCTTAESTFHLFFSCQFAFNLWCWLATILNLTIQFQCMEDLWRLCDRAWSPQCKFAIKSVIVNIINSIWMARNKARFNNRAIHWKNAVSWISANTLIAGNRTSLCSNASLSDFRILKHFNISIHPPRAPSIKEIFWKPPCAGWVKCNSDGASTHTSSSCGGIFRNHHADFLCCFAENTGVSSAYFAELCGAMKAIEIAHDHNWNNLWLESDSTLVVMAFKNASLVPWRLRNRWNNCIQITASMNFMISHIFREGNKCADSLANLGLSLVQSQIWYHIPQAIFESFIVDKLGRANYRFCNL